jgi:iron complex outermembrane receptor protein
LIGAKAEREGQRDATAYIWDGISKFEETTDEALILAPTDSRNIYSAFLEDQLNIGEKLSVNAGLRYDYFQNFANSELSRLNPRVGVTYKASESVIVKLLWVRAFRPPTNYELQGVSLPPLVGNPGVGFEHLETYEANLIYKKKNFKLQVTPYLQTYLDRILYIDTDPTDSDVILQAHNVGNTTTLGVEFTGNYYFSATNYLFVGCSSYNAEDEIDGVASHTPFLPTLFFNTGLNFRKNNFGFNTTAYFHGERHLPEGMPINSKHATGSIFNANVNISFFLAEASRIYLLVENVTDQKTNIPYVTDGAFFPLRSRTYNIGMVVKF